MIIGTRHGERADQTNNEIERAKIEKSYDVHLTDKGAVQCSKSGEYIKSIIGNKKAIVICSPFLRTIQTAVNAAQHLNVYNNTIYLQDEVGEILIPEDFKENPHPKIHVNENGFEKVKSYIDYEKLGFKLEKNGFVQDERMIKAIYPEDLDYCVKRLTLFQEALVEKFSKEFSLDDHVICIFSHQGPLRAWRIVLNRGNEDGLPIYNYCGITIAEWEDMKKEPNKWVMSKNGNNEHIKDYL